MKQPMPAPEELQQEVNRHNWFHAIDFGNGVQSAGRKTEYATKNWTLVSVFKLLESIDFKGFDCLDIGTFDGLTAFILKKEGAKHVVGTDIFDLPTFRLAKEILNLSVEYAPGLSLEQLPQTLNDGPFDLIVCAGVLYHLYSPLQGITNCRKLIKNNGLAVFETEYVAGDNPVLLLNSAKENYYPEPFTYFRPTLKCLEDMLRFCCFEPIASARVSGSKRIAVLAQARKPSELTNTEGALQMIHSQIRPILPEYLDFRALEADQSSSSISHSLAETDIVIDIDSFQTRFDLHVGGKA